MEAIMFLTNVRTLKVAICSYICTGWAFT